MRIANISGRLVLATPSGYVDVAKASGGVFGPDPQSVYEVWDDFVGWAGQQSRDGEIEGEITGAPLADFGPPVPAPRQVFAIGLNYAAHATEAGSTVPPAPPTFTKFPTCLAGPDVEVVLPTDTVDWEVELVAVIARRADHVAVADAWSYVAGLTIGQDLSERTSQLSGPVPQFSLAKSFPQFGPTGPDVVTVDELPNPDDLGLGCSINGVTMQDGRTKDMIFSVPELVSRLSAVCPLLPGDLIFTGTPSGVGMGRNPKMYLAPGDVLDTWIEGLGTMRTRLIAAP